MKVRKLFFVVILLIVLLGFSSLLVLGQTVRITHELSPSLDTPSHAFCVVLEHYLEAGTDMEAQIYPNNELGGVESMVEQMQEGDLQIAVVSFGGLSHFYDKIMIFDLDYAFPRGDERIVDKLWDKNNEFTSTVFTEIQEEVGIMPLGLMRRGGWAAITNSIRPIQKLEDMKGITLRAMDKKQAMLFEALGGSAVVVPWTEIYTALQTGVADGQRNPISIFLDASLNEVQDFVSLPGMAPGSAIVVVDPNWYDNLSKQEKSALDQGVYCGLATARGLSYRSVATEIESLEKAGMEIYIHTEEEYEEFRNAGLEGLLEWAYDQWGNDFVDTFFEEIKRIEEEVYG